MDKLKPCPFCGGEAKAYQHGDVGFIVQCRRCGIWNAGYSPAWSHITEDEFHGFIAKDDAIKAWNTRAYSEATTEAVTEEMLAAAGYFKERTCKDANGGGYTFVCSECTYELYMPFGWNFGYCPNCGAKVVE